MTASFGRGSESALSKISYVAEPRPKEAVKRFRRVDYGHLEIELTLDDPKAYTKPWTVKLYQILTVDTDLLDYICAENEKDIRHMVK